MKWKIKGWDYKELVAFLIALFPILAIYSYSFTVISVGYTLLLLMVVIAWVKEGSIYIDKVLLFFVAYSVLQQIILMITDGISYKVAMGLLIQRVVTVLILGQLVPMINLDKVYKWYKIFAILAMLGILYQSYEVYIAKKLVDPILLLPLENVSSWAFNSYRPMSFFQEPSQFSSYMLMFLILNLKHRDYLLGVLSTIAIALSASTLGVVVAVVIWCIYIFTTKTITLGKRLSVIICMIAFAIIYVTADIFSVSSEKLSTLGTSFSDYTRLYKGLETFLAMPISYKILGIGQGTVAYFASKFHFDFTWMSVLSHVNYQTTGFGIFVEYGIVGGIIFYGYYFKNFLKLKVKKDDMAIILMVTVLLMTFTSTFFFNAMFLFYFLIFESYTDLHNVGKVKIKCR